MSFEAYASDCSERLQEWHRYLVQKGYGSGSFDDRVKRIAQMVEEADTYEDVEDIYAKARVVVADLNMEGCVHPERVSVPMDRAALHYWGALKAYGERRVDTAMSMLVEAFRYVGMVEGAFGILITRTTNHDHLKAASRGGQAKGKPGRDAVEYLADLLRKHRPLDGWTKREAKQAVIDEMREYAQRRHGTTSNFEGAIDRWLRSEVAVEAGSWRSKK